MRPKFHPGRTYATPGAIGAMEEARQAPAEFLDRHLSGDWGTTAERAGGVYDSHDSALNNRALASVDDRIFSAYRTSRGEKLWVRHCQLEQQSCAFSSVGGVTDG